LSGSWGTAGISSKKKKKMMIKRKKKAKGASVITGNSAAVCTAAYAAAAAEEQVLVISAAAGDMGGGQQAGFGFGRMDGEESERWKLRDWEKGMNSLEQSIIGKVLLLGAFLSFIYFLWR
jgi:hypothetical protein